MGSQSRSRTEYSEKPIPPYRCALVVRVWALFFAAWAGLPLLFFIPTVLARDPVFFLRATKLPLSVLRSIMPCVCFLAISINCRVRAAETPRVSAMSYGVAKRPRSLIGCRIVPKLYAGAFSRPNHEKGSLRGSCASSALAQGRVLLAPFDFAQGRLLKPCLHGFAARGLPLLARARTPAPTSRTVGCIASHP